MFQREILIKDTHRGLYYKDGVLVKILSAGRYVIPWHINLALSAGSPAPYSDRNRSRDESRRD